MSRDRVIRAENLPKVNEVTLTRNILWNGREVTVRRFLSIREVSAFVNNVVSACIHDDKLVAELLDFAFRINVIMSYALIELPEDIDHQYWLVYETDLYDTIIKYVNQAQLDSIRKAIELYI